jgi:formate hydrogenlyase transcriptional activator
MAPDGTHPEVDLRRYEALLQMADLVVRHCELEELFRELAQRLRDLTSAEFVAFSLHEPTSNLMQVYSDAGKFATPREMPTEETPGGWVWQHQLPMLIRDTESENRFLEKMQLLGEAGVRSYCALPLTTARRRLGSLGLGSAALNTYDENDLQFLQRAAKFVAIAVENALTQGALQQEKDRLQMLLEVNAALVSNLDLQEHFPAISGYIRRVVNYDFASIDLYEESSQTLYKYALDFPSAPGAFHVGQKSSVHGSFFGQAFLERQTMVFPREQLRGFTSDAIGQLLDYGIQTVCCAPLLTPKAAVGTLNLASRQADAFAPRDLRVLKQIAGQIAVALDNDHAYRELARLKDKLAAEKKYLQGEIYAERNFEDIIGESPALKAILHTSKTVAGSDANVLILGETGTGKELIARAIHRMSSRKDGSFIKLNCAAIPTGLLESELFGHEKGAFTGAVSQKIGRLELADKGTLLLDEVGDILSSCSPSYCGCCRIRNSRGWAAPEP